MADQAAKFWQAFENEPARKSRRAASANGSASPMALDAEGPRPLGPRGPDG